MTLLWIQKTIGYEAQLKKAYHHDAGLDIVSAENYTIPPGGWHNFRTGLYIGVPAGFVGTIKGRGGLSMKHCVEVGGGGVVDPGYRGEVRVKLYNFGDQPYEVLAGDRIAQLLVYRIEPVVITPTHDLPGSDRDTNGFSSSGR